MLGRNSVNALVCYKIVLYSNILKGCFGVHDGSLEAIMPNDQKVKDMWNWQQIPTIIDALTDVS